MNVAQMIREKLDELGADGLMLKSGVGYYKNESIQLAVAMFALTDLVPAFCHADGTYHTEKEKQSPCAGCKICIHVNKDLCFRYQSWLSHKEAPK